jgi:hypothetical protein
MTTHVYHLRRLSNDEHDRLNANGWGSDPRFTRYADITTSGNADAVRDAWRLGEYELVAEVETDDLDAVFELTNHIDRNWTENARVTAKAARPRSTSVGDVLRDANGGFHVVASVGFAPLPLNAVPELRTTLPSTPRKGLGYTIP